MATPARQAPRYSALKVAHIISGDSWAGAEMQAFTQLCSLRGTGIVVWVVLMNHGELESRLRDAGIDVTVLDERVLSAIRILKELCKLLRSRRPDVVHTHRLKENILGSAANALSVRAACIRTVHGAPEHRQKIWTNPARWLTSTVDQLCGRFLQDRIIAVSMELGEKLREFFPDDLIVVIENGIDPEYIRQRKGAVNFRDTAPHDIHVGIVGRLVPVKRIDLFLDTAAELQRRRPEQRWRFHVFGSGPLLEAISAKIQECGLIPVVTLHGHRNDIVACISALDVLVITSDHEGLPMAALEAMAVGTPIVAHGVGGLVDVLAAARHSRLINSQDPKDYADSIGDLIGVPKPPKPEIPSRFLAATNASKVAAIYRELTRGSGGP